MRVVVYEHHTLPDGRREFTEIVNAQKTYDGRLLPLTADLSHLAGRSVGIELRVDAGASSDHDWAVWVDPRVVSD